MPRGRPVDSKTRARILELIIAGDLSRNAIAREAGVSGAVVTGIAQDNGLVFDHSKSELAVAAANIDLAVQKAEIARMIALEVRRSLEDMHSPATIVQWASATEHQKGGWKEHVLPEPSVSDRRNLMTIVGIGVTKIAELTRTAAAEGSPEALTFIDGLANTLSVVKSVLEGGVDPTALPEDTSRDALIAEYAGQVEAEKAQTAAETSE